MVALGNVPSRVQAPSARKRGMRSHDSGFTLAGTRKRGVTAAAEPRLLPPLLGLLPLAAAPARSIAELASTGARIRLTRRLRPPEANSDAAVAAAAAGLLETTVGSKLRTARLSRTDTDRRPEAGAAVPTCVVGRPAPVAAACSSAAAISSATASDTRNPCGRHPDLAAALELSRAWL